MGNNTDGNSTIFLSYSRLLLLDNSSKPKYNFIKTIFGFASIRNAHSCANNVALAGLICGSFITAHRVIPPAACCSACFVAFYFFRDSSREILFHPFTRIINNFLAIFLSESALLGIGKNIQNNFRRTAQTRPQRCHHNRAVNQDRMLQHKVD